jgi:hypothetical protein
MSVLCCVHPPRRREKTHAARHYADDVPADVKAARLAELMALFREGQRARVGGEVGALHLMLVEGPARKAGSLWAGKSDGMHKLVLGGADSAAPGGREELRIPASLAEARGEAFGGGRAPRVGVAAGDYVAVRVARLAGDVGATLVAHPVARTTLGEFFATFGAAAVPADAAAAIPWLAGRHEGGALQEGGALMAAAAGGM